MRTNIQNIADKLAGAWARHRSWMKVAEAAVECACQKEELPEYRYLEQGEILQAGDDFSFKKSPWFPVTEWIGCALSNPDYQVRRRVDTVDTVDPEKANLKAVNADQRVQIEHLEKTLEVAQKGNRDYLATVADRDATIRRLKEKLEAAEPFVPTHVSHQLLQEKLEKAARYIDGLENDLSAVSSQRDNLEAVAKQASHNTEFYRQLVTDIGDMFGLLAKVNDDGMVCQDVLVMKVPELVAKLIIKSEE